MKKAILILIIMGAISIQSCSKCFQCETTDGRSQRTICKGEPLFQPVKDGHSITDNNGNEMFCAPN
jgi:hypothetical protein